MSEIKTCVSLYSLQDEYLNHRMDLKDIMHFVKDNGVQGVEILPDQMLKGAPDISDETVAKWHELLKETGLTPVIAHPERYLCIQRVPAHAYEWYQMGAVLQIDQGSVLGRFGSGAGDAARLLLRHRLAGAAASDAHRSYTRAPRLSQLWEILADEYGKDCPALLLRENPARILQGKPVFRRQPLPFEYAKFS